MKQLSDSLSDIVPGLIDLQLDAKAPSTVLKYKSGWLRWREWALSKFGVPVIPAKPLHIALFISELAKRSSEDNIGISSIESAVYAITWGRAMAGIEACPVSHPLVKLALGGAKRMLARPVQPEEPLSVRTVQVIATHFASSASLSDLRFLFILLVGFAGFFRIDEISNIALRDVSIHSDHMSLHPGYQLIFLSSALPSMLLLPVAFCTPMHKHECDLNIKWCEGANVIMLQHL